MNKCEMILAMIAGMFQAVFKGVRYRKRCYCKTLLIRGAALRGGIFKGA